MNATPSIQTTIMSRQIETHYDPKPIPLRQFDWVAKFDDYDAEMIDGEWRSSCPQGFGRTEAEAIADLMEQVEDDDPSYR